jgi:tetratricopeptide (TPR) repeat protein
MKIQVRSILFALVLPIAACGGDREEKLVDLRIEDHVQLPKADTQPATSVAVDVAEQPKLVDVEKPMPTKYDELLVAGKDLVVKGQYGDAKTMFDAAIKLEKKKAEPHIELARMYITMNEKGLAVASANKAVKLAPDSSQAWNTKGRAELSAHKYEEAIEAFTKSVELNDTNVFAWNNLGYTELLLKRYEDAAEHLLQATSRDGATGYMFNNLGTALEHLDQLDDARTAYEMGGTLGSTAAASSRKRLEGVDSIAIAKAEPVGEIHDEVRAEAPQVKEYTNVDESDDIVDPDEMTANEDAGNETSEELESQPSTPDDEVAPSDQATM